MSGGSVLRDVISPVRILFYPIVLWASIAMGFAANSLLVLNLTQAQVFGAPPYLFNPDQIGLVNFAFVVGAAIALFTAGPFSDWMALRRARRNGGILEAEMRLPALAPYAAINLVGMVVTALGYQRSWPWEVIIIVGYMLVGIQVVGIPAIAISYAVDCYKSLPGEIMIAATIVKNTFGVRMNREPVNKPRLFPFADYVTVWHDFLRQQVGSQTGIYGPPIPTYVAHCRLFRSWAGTVHPPRKEISAHD